MAKNKSNSFRNNASGSSKNTNSNSSQNATSNSSKDSSMKDTHSQVPGKGPSRSGPGGE